MIDPKNHGSLIGGLVADPEMVNDGKIARLRIAADYAGNDRDNTDNKSGYFNVTYFLNNDDSNTKFVKSQIDKGNLKKGSQVHIIYRLIQDRWSKEGQKNSAVTLVAEALTYAGSGQKPEGGESSSASNSGTGGNSEPSSIPDSF